MVESASLDQAAGQQLLSAVSAQAGFPRGSREWADFERRFHRYFPDLARLFQSLYGSRPDFQEQLESLVLEAALSWKERPADLKEIDARRESDSDWFQSSRSSLPRSRSPTAAMPCPATGK
ncbi:MAG: amylosucrase [Arthrobacter sp.]|nr:amylosucrase [Arthrobacter sp.]